MDGSKKGIDLPICTVHVSIQPYESTRLFWGDPYTFQKNTPRCRWVLWMTPIGHPLGFRLIRMISEPTTVTFLDSYDFLMPLLWIKMDMVKKIKPPVLSVTESRFFLKNASTFSNLDRLVERNIIGKTPAKLDEDHVPILLQIKQVTCKRCQDFDGFCGLPLFLACRLQAKHEKYMCARVCETIPSSTKLGATGPAHLVSVVMKLSIVFWQISLAHVLFETHVITIWFCVWFWSSFSHSTFKFVGPKKVIKDGSGTCPIYRKTSRHKAFKESHRGCPIITLDDWRAILTRLCPPVISWFIIPINYRYIYHKP